MLIGVPQSAVATGNPAAKSNACSGHWSALLVGNWRADKTLIDDPVPQSMYGSPLVWILELLHTTLLAVLIIN